MSRKNKAWVTLVRPGSVRRAQGKRTRYTVQVMNEQETVLVVEDDPNIVELLKLHLSDLGFQTDTAGNGRAGLEKALSREYALIILDLMLPGVDGLEICRRVREKTHHVPILMLTAKSEELDKVVGLELGADDYMTKPFSTRELIARVKAITRRVRDIREEAEHAGAAETIRLGALEIDQGRRRVTESGRAIDLTAKEYELLFLLASNPGQAFNREQLLDRVWGYQYDGYSHTVNSHINRLRSKLEADPSHPRYIRTVWGYGYRFAESGEV